MEAVVIALDERRDIFIPGGKEETLHYCAEHFVNLLGEAIAARGKAAIALSGGSTPKAIYQKIASSELRGRVDWSKVFLFWSDERSVPPTSPDSNFKMAMDAGFGSLGIPTDHIKRMRAEEDLDRNAVEYEEQIKRFSPEGQLDLVMLGMGEDGHTASLFPLTHALHVEDRLVTANYVPQVHSWRMTLTFPGIHAGRNIVFYVLGKSKAEKVKEVLTGPYNPDHLPAQAVGTVQRKALWILDREAGSHL
jgi:6-phosphogluconolactonase